MDQINFALKEYDEKANYCLSSMKQDTLPESREISATH